MVCLIRPNRQKAVHRESSRREGGFVPLFSCALLLLLLSGLFFPPGLAAQKDGEDWDVLSGRVSLKLIQREYTPDDPTVYQAASDQDLYLQLKLDSRFTRDGRYQFHFLGLTKSDLDGNQDSAAYYPLEGPADAGASSTRNYLFQSQFDINYLYSFLSQIRLGRQTGTRDEMITFDGLAADLEPTRSMKLTFYGGKAVHFYEFGKEEQSDTLGGVGLDLFTRSPTRISLDYLHIKDITDPGVERKDNLLAFKLTQHFGDTWRARLRSRRINGEARDIKLRASGSISSINLMVQALYFRQHKIQQELGVDFSPFIEVLGQSHPYTVMELKALWRFFEDYGLTLGHYQRSLNDNFPIDPTDLAFNRDFTRDFLVIDVDHLVARGLSLALTGESWKSGEIKQDSQGLDLSYRFGDDKKKSRISMGSYYTLYKYDYYTQLGERTQVRTNYLKGKHPLGDAFSLNWSLEVEKSLGTYQTAKLGVRYEF